MAIVEADMFGKRHKVKFGFFTDEDPELPAITRLKACGEIEKADVLDGKVKFDIGIYPGDNVRDDTGIYGDQVFEVKQVDAGWRVIITPVSLVKC